MRKWLTKQQPRYVCCIFWGMKSYPIIFRDKLISQSNKDPYDITNQHFMVHVAYGGFWSPFPARKNSRCRGDGICGINGVAGGAAVNEGGMLFFSHCKYHLVEYEQLSCMQVLWLVSLLSRCFCWRLVESCCFLSPESGGWQGACLRRGPKVDSKLPVWLVDSRQDVT